VLSWRKHNPDYEVCLIDRDNIKEFPNLGWALRLLEEGGMSIQAFSDILRINLLSSLGGVWADATCLCTRPLSSWLTSVMDDGCDFFAYRNSGRGREIASWFLASRKDSYIARKYSDLVVKYWAAPDCSVPLKKASAPINKLCSYSRYIGGIFSSTTFFRLTRIYPYFWFHFIFYKLINIDVKARKCWKATACLYSEDAHLAQKIGFHTKKESYNDQLDIDNLPPVMKLVWNVELPEEADCLIVELLERCAGEVKA
jgi:hypothetical protein